MGPEEFVLICVYVLAGLIGLCVGSFLNVVIYRTPNGMSLSKPASHCTSCDYTLKWYDNVPVLSYIFLGGKCRKCKARISPRYMCVEILNALLWLLSVYLFWEESIPYACIAAVTSSVLICIFFIDLEHLLIFNRFTLIIALCGAVAMFFDGFTEWHEHITGAIVAGLMFLAIYYGSILILKKEGLGFGDVKLVTAAGLLLGWQRLILAVLVSSVIASIVLLIVRKARRDETDHEYPFGPFLAVGIAFAMFVGAPIINWYVGLLSF